MKPLKVFVVDDDPDLAEGLSMVLEIEGHEVEIARTGKEAIEKFREQDFDLTFMDIRMPGMNGVESLMQLRKIKPDAKVIMMTAFSVGELLDQAIDEGALGLLHKPISGDAILKALSDATPAGIILLADDDPDFVEGVQSLLSASGYEVAVASSGQEAVELALRQDIDALLLDLRMPILNGLEVYLELKRQGRTVPTIIMTGYDVQEAEQLDKLRQLSVSGCLVKPIRGEDLLRAIKKVV